MKDSPKKPTHDRKRNHDMPRKTERDERDEEIDDELDEALKDTFPASDPIAVHKKKKSR